MEGQFAMDRITWKNKTSLFILIFGHACLGRELDSLLLFLLLTLHFSSWCLDLSEVKWRIPQSDFITEWYWESGILSTVCQDVLKRCPSLSVARPRMLRMEWPSAPPAPQRSSQPVLSHQDCLVHKHLGWWHDFSSGREPKTLPVFMAAAITSICEKTNCRVQDAWIFLIFH